MKRGWFVLAGLAVIGALFSTTALAATSAADAVNYRAVLTPLNNSGVSGTMDFIVEGTQLNFHVEAYGLEAYRAHGMQIRGFSGATTDAALPPSSAAGADGIMTLEEAQVYLGDRLL